MQFLTDKDLKTVIEEDALTETEGANTERKDDAEIMALSQVEDHLNVRYDTATMLTRTGAARHRSIIRIMIDLTVYHLHANINANNIPELRQKRYDRAIKDLESIRDGITSPLGLPEYADDEDEENPGNWGLWSGDKFVSDY